MIERYKNQAIRAATWFVGAGVAAAICVGAAAGLSDPPWGLGVLLAVGAVCSGALAAVCYCQAILLLARAKGYSAAFFTSVFLGPFVAVILKSFIPDISMIAIAGGLGALVPLALAIFMPDQSNVARDLEESRYAGARCVQCNGRIPSSVKLCPHCGYTQPSAETASSTAPAAPVA